MNPWWSDITTWVLADETAALWRGLLVFVVGVASAMLATTLLGRLLAERVSPQRAALIPRISRSLLIAATLLISLDLWGVDLSLLLGTAGIVTIAVGFASKTAASNIISGIFLIGESPFKIGDVIRVGQTTGEIVSIDLLSVRLRTFDNIMVRLPNEQLLQSEISTLTHFPIRRLDLPLAISYEADLTIARRVLEAVAASNPLCLRQPAAAVHFLEFGPSAVRIQLSAWCAAPHFLSLKLTLAEQMLSALTEAGVPTPYPRQVVHLEGPTSAPEL